MRWRACGIKEKGKIIRRQPGKLSGREKAEHYKKLAPRTKPKKMVSKLGVIGLEVLEGSHLSGAWRGGLFLRVKRGEGVSL